MNHAQNTAAIMRCDSCGNMISGDCCYQSGRQDALREVETVLDGCDIVVYDEHGKAFHYQPYLFLQKRLREKK